MRTAVPALGNSIAGLWREDAGTAKTELEDRHLIAVDIAGGGVAGHNTWVVGDVGQHHAGLKVTRTDAVRPRHPLRSEKRLLPRQQGGLGHGCDTVEHRQINTPHPAAIAGQLAFEVNDDTGVGRVRAEETADSGRVIRRLDGGLTCDLLDVHLSGSCHLSRPAARRQHGAPPQPSLHVQARGTCLGAARSRRSRAS